MIQYIIATCTIISLVATVYTATFKNNIFQKRDHGNDESYCEQ